MFFAAPGILLTLSKCLIVDGSLLRFIPSHVFHLELLGSGGCHSSHKCIHLLVLFSFQVSLWFELMLGSSLEALFRKEQAWLLPRVFFLCLFISSGVLDQSALVTVMRQKQGSCIFSTPPPLNPKPCFDHATSLPLTHISPVHRILRLISLCKHFW